MYQFCTKAAFVVLLFVGLSAQAQSILLDDVQVTANRYAQKLTQTGKTITIINDSTLRANAGLTLSQILQTQSGLLVVGKDQPYGSVQSISTRGAGFGQTLILIDGVPVYEPSGIGNSFDLSFLPIQNIERIEILKDGQSTIYGSDALAGVINIISKKAQSKKVNLTGGLLAGSYGTVNAHASINGSINKTQYILSVSSLNSKGFSSAAAPDQQKFEKDGYGDLGINGKINQQLTSALSAYLSAKYQRYKTDLDEAAFSDDKDYTFESANTQLGGGLQYDYAKGKVIFNYLGSDIKRTFINDSTHIPANAWSIFSSNEYQSMSNFFELYTTINAAKNNHLLIGTSLQKQNMDYHGYEYSAYGKTDYDPVPKNLAKITNSALYATWVSKFNNGFGFEIGTRENFHSAYGSKLTYNINPYYLIDNQFKLFASYGSSFRNPALYQLYSPYGNLKLKPENVQSYEAGFQIFGNAAKDYFRLVAFGRQYDNMIIFESIGQAPWGIYNNLHKKSTNHGVELEGNKYINKLSLGFNYTFLNGLISDNLTKDKDQIMAFLRRPNHTLNLKVSYSFNEKLSVGVQTQTLSKRNDTYYNAATFASEARILDAYTLVNLQVQYSLNSKLKLHLSGQNILNEKFEEIYGYNSKGAAFLGGVTFNF